MAFLFWYNEMGGENVKRDMDLIRRLLLLIEEQSDNGLELEIPQEIDRIIAVKHLEMLEEAGLVKNRIQYGDNSPVCIFSSLTWEGHDFLENIKNDTVWNKLKETIKEKSGQLSWVMIIEFAKEIMKTAF